MTAPFRTNAVVAGALLIVATVASLLSGPFLAPVTGVNHLVDRPPTRARWPGAGVLRLEP